MSLGHGYAKLLSIGSQVNVWHQTVRTHNACHTSQQLLEQGPQLVILDTSVTSHHSKGHSFEGQALADGPLLTKIIGSKGVGFKTNNN